MDWFVIFDIKAFIFKSKLYCSNEKHCYGNESEKKYLILTTYNIFKIIRYSVKVRGCSKKHFLQFCTWTYSYINYGSKIV